MRRTVFLDAVRIVACLMVVMLHGPVTYMAACTPSTAYAMFLTVADGTNLFFIISGALLLPVTQPWRTFVKRRVWRVLWPLLAWSVIYLAEGMARGTLSLVDAVRLQPEADHLWYLYMAIVIYVTLPIVSRAITAVGDRGVAAYLLLWLASSLIPFWHGILGEFAPMQHPLSVVHNCYGYVILGYWLRRHPLPLFTRRHGWWLALVMAAGIVGVPLFEFAVQTGLTWCDHIAAINNNVSVNAVLTAVLVFTILQSALPEGRVNPEGRAARVARRVSECTFGIYLMHALVMREFTAPVLHGWVYGHAVHPLAAGIAAGLVTFAVSLAVMAVYKSVAVGWRARRS